FGFATRFGTSRPRRAGSFHGPTARSHPLAVFSHPFSRGSHDPQSPAQALRPLAKATVDGRSNQALCRSSCGLVRRRSDRGGGDVLRTAVATQRVRRTGVQAFKHGNQRGMTWILIWKTSITTFCWLPYFGITAACRPKRRSSSRGCCGRRSSGGPLG